MRSFLLTFVLALITRPAPPHRHTVPAITSAHHALPAASIDHGPPELILDTQPIVISVSTPITLALSRSPSSQCGSAFCLSDRPLLL